MIRSAVLGLVLQLILLAAPGAAERLLVLSLDGFRWDYLERPSAAWLRQFAERGVRAEGLIPCFPSKTYPSHYTIATGLHPEHHGVVSNVIHDPRDGKTFSPQDPVAVQEERWWGGEPIWVTATKQGRISGICFWPGSEAPIQGVHPKHWKVYDHHRPFLDQSKEILSWLDAPAAERPSLMLSYFREPDGAGHAFGPKSSAVDVSITALVEALQALEKGLEERGLLATTDILIVSDHGMTPVSRDKVIYLDDYVKPEQIAWTKPEPVTMLWPKEGQTDDLHAKLVKAHPHLRVYRKDEIPPELHFREHRLIPPLVAMADLGWMVRLHSEDTLLDAAVFPGGAHGFSNQEKDMWGIFLARGPSFRSGLRPEAFPNVHVYALMCRLLGLEPAKHDGDPAVTEAFLATAGPRR